MKTWLAFDIMEFLGVPTPLRSFVWVTVNGQPWGLFLAVEEPEEAFARRNFGANHGQLYKPDYRSLAEENADVHLRYTTDEPEDYPGIFENAKLESSAADRQRLVDSLKTLDSGQRLEEAVDVDEVLRYFVGQVFVMNWDSYLGHTGHNSLLYEEEGKLSMLPWDYNLAFGGFQGNDATSSVNDPIDDVLSDRPMQAWIFSSEAYTARYHEYYAEFLQTANIDALIDETYQLIAPYVEKDLTKFCTAEEFETGVQTLKTYCALRERSV